jgi:hypothetical protein
MNAPTRHVWVMTRDRRRNYPHATWVASTPSTMTQMADSLSRAMDIRRAAAINQGVESWTDTGAPKIVLAVDEGIDIGSLADEIVRHGKAAGVELRIEHFSERE